MAEKTQEQIENAELLELLAQHTGDNGQVMVRIKGGAFLFAVMKSPKYISNLQVAEAAGVSASTVSHLDSRPISLKTAKKIADTLDSKVSDLFTLVTPVEA